MKMLKVLLFIMLITFIGALAGCQNQRRSIAEMEAIDYSLYGPYEMDITNQ